MSNEEQEAPGQAGNKQGLCLRILSTNPTRTTRQQPVIYHCECLKRLSESSCRPLMIVDHRLSALLAAQAAP